MEDSRIFVHSAPTFDLESALQSVREVFAQVAATPMPENYYFAGVTFSGIATVTLSPDKRKNITHISETQMEYIRTLAAKAGINPHAWCRDIFDVNLQQLNKLQAYAIIAVMEKAVRTLE